jgi:hypothetical protein
MNDIFIFIEPNMDDNDALGRCDKKGAYSQLGEFMGETFNDCFLDVIRDNIESTLI